MQAWILCMLKKCKLKLSEIVHWLSGQLHWKVDQSKLRRCFAGLSYWQLMSCTNLWCWFEAVIRVCLACVSVLKSLHVAATSLTVVSTRNAVVPSAQLVRSRVTAATVRWPKIRSCVSTTCSGAEVPTSYAKVTHSIHYYYTNSWPQRLCFRLGLFVSWFGCLPVSRSAQKVIDGFHQIFWITKFF